MATIRTAWRDLTEALEGEVVLPGSPRYDEVRKPQIPRFHDVRPQAVVLCRTPEDVVEAIAFARRSGIEVAVRSGGHDFAGRSSGPGMVLDLTPMHSLEVSGGLATVGPGSRLGDLYVALARHERTIPGGCGATVGIGGQALGGGLGLWAAAGGSPRTRSSRRRWCWRTGGWWSATSSATTTCSGRCAARAPWASGWSRASRSARCPSPRPARPPHLALRARSGADRRLAGVVAGGARRTRREHAPHRRRGAGRRAGGPPVRLDDRWRDRDRGAARRVRVGYPGGSHLLGAGAHALRLAEGLPGGPRPGRPGGRGRPPVHEVGVLPRAAAGRRGRGAGGSSSGDAAPGRRGSWTSCPGAARTTACPWTPPRSPTARSASCSSTPSSSRPAFDAAAIEGARAWLSESWELVHPRGSGGVYGNFPDADLPDEHRAYWGGNLERLRSVKERYDPEGVFG